jgi:hypothetical protein
MVPLEVVGLEAVVRGNGRLCLPVLLDIPQCLVERLESVGLGASW